MEVIKINHTHIFLLELSGNVSDGAKELIAKQWAELLPDNKIIIVTEGTLKLLEKESK